MTDDTMLSFRRIWNYATLKSCLPWGDRTRSTPFIIWGKRRCPAPSFVLCRVPGSLVCGGRLSYLLPSLVLLESLLRAFTAIFSTGPRTWSSYALKRFPFVPWRRLDRNPIMFVAGAITKTAAKTRSSFIPDGSCPYHVSCAIYWSTLDQRRVIYRKEWASVHEWFFDHHFAAGHKNS